MRSHHGRNRMVIGFKLPVQSVSITTNVVRWNPTRRGVLDTILCDKVCQWLATGSWFSPGTPVSSTNETDSHDITEILLKVALNSITHTHWKDQSNWNYISLLWSRQHSIWIHSVSIRYVPKRIWLSYLLDFVEELPIDQFIIHSCWTLTRTQNIFF